MRNSSIEWTDHTFNPWIGCTKVSDGCKFCYADVLAKRFKHATWGPRGTRKIAANDNWKAPIRWNAKAGSLGIRYRVFCASMGDVFEDASTMPASEYPKIEAARQRLFDLIDQTPNLDWQILTKRPENVLAMWPGGNRANVWLGTSVEDGRVLQRVTDLVACHHLADKFFISAEPLIGAVRLPLVGIDWVIVGGESGVQSRPMDAAWAAQILADCQARGVDFFMKQLGNKLAKQHGVPGKGVDPAQWPQPLQYLNVRQFP